MDLMSSVQSKTSCLEAGSPTQMLHALMHVELIMCRRKFHQLLF